MNLFSFHGPAGDDWDPQGYSDEDKTAEDLAALGMHDTSDNKDKKEEDDLIDDPEKIVPVILVDVEEDEEVDGLAELDILEKKVREDEFTMGSGDEE